MLFVIGTHGKPIIYNSNAQMAGLDPVGILLTLNILFPNRKSDVQQVFLSVFSEDS